MQKKLNAFHLKTIAIIAMVLNHFGAVFELRTNLPWLFIFTEIIGKLTFPIMAYLLVDGFKFTKNKKKYVLRLAIFSLISVVPFWLAFRPESNFAPRELVNNVIFTLMMGLIMMIVLKKAKNKFFNVILLIAFAGSTVLSDWPIVGVCMIYGFFQIKNPMARIIAPIIYTGVLPTIINLLLMRESADPYTLVHISTLAGVVLVIPILLAYNGKRGSKSAVAKWGFYAFYPGHLLALYLIKSAVNLLF